MADLKTTAEERARMQRYADWITAHAGHSATELRAVARAVPLILDDFDTLLAENARLRAAEAEAERLRGLCGEAAEHIDPMRWGHGTAGERALVARLARAALGEP